MAECSYARCLQERRFIKRELLKWSKDMVQVIGLERFAEELMGRRKWKHFQEVLSRSQLNTNQNRTDQTNNFDPSEQTNIENLEPSILENHLTEKQEEEVEEQFTTQIKTEIKDNLNIINDKINNKEIVKDTLINSIKTSPKIGEEPINNPIDWKPSDKCYFCVDGKLLTVNEKGDLVAESGPALPEAELANRSTIDSDSDSSNSTPDTITNNHTQLNTKKLITSHTRDSHPPNMTSFESMAAQIAAISKIQGLQSGLGQLYPSLWYHQLAQLPLGPTTSETSAAALSPSNKDSSSPSETTGEQPLDLSSKPSPVFRAKPRINTTVAGRRTYTEEELAMALQDILSGKLGTRRAAVIYGIPRSTLRNKVYKIAMEQKREISSTSSHQPNLDSLDPDDDDKDGSGDDERDDKLIDSSLLIQQQTDLLSSSSSRFDTSHLPPSAALQKHRKSNIVNNEIDIVKPSTSSSTLDGQNKLLHSPINQTVTVGAGTGFSAVTTTPQQSQTPPITPNRWLDTNVLLQSLLLSGSLGGLPNLLQQQQQQQPKMDDPAALQEVFNTILMQQEEILKEQLKNSTGENRDNLNNGKSNLIDPLLLMQNLPLLRQQQQQQLNQLQSSSSSRIPKSETPDTSSSVDLNETNDDGVILKIPSFKPVVPGSSQSSSKNGDSAISPSSITGLGLSSILSRSPHQINNNNNNNMSGISPPLMRQSSESQSPPILSLREVIANSISRTFSQQQQQQQQQKDSNIKSYNQHESSSSSSLNEQQQQNKKRASISVIKTIGGTDITQFASTPNLLNTYHHHHHHHHHQNALNAAANAAGKGTRPKRGKYRNYDRDSLVEAVKSVQRGEMSVHRAGSYYGVPHSTLEYKVKERHLMRPRKREPKPQNNNNNDERSGSNNNNSNISSGTKHSNIPGLTNVVNNIDKLKSPSVSGGQQQSKSSSLSLSGLKNSNNSTSFPSTSPNGMKLPIFDSAMAAQLQYAPHLFWPHTAASFSGLPIDFQRQAAAAAAVNAASVSGTTGQQSSTSGFTTQNAESFLASQMIQRFHEETNRLNAAAAATTITSNNNNNNSNNYQKSSNISPSLITTTNSITTTPNTTLNLNNINNNNNTNTNNNINNNTININNSCSGGSSSSSSNSSNGSISNVPIAKSAREIAESLYDTGGANGSSFLDGIIRQTLDRKSNNDIKPHGALLDQLVKNTNKTISTTSNTYNNNNNINENHHLQLQQENQHNIHQSLTNNNNSNNNKRSGSPIQYPVIDIKRERSNSPISQQQQQQHSHLSMALTPTAINHHNKRNSLTDCNKLTSTTGSDDISIESSDNNNDNLNNDITKIIKSSNDNNNMMIKLEDNQLNSLVRLQQHHQLHQQLTSSISSSTSSSNIRPIIGDDINGGNSISGNSNNSGGIISSGGVNNNNNNSSSILQEKLGHIKSETEDSL